MCVRGALCAGTLCAHIVATSPEVVQAAARRSRSTYYTGTCTAYSISHRLAAATCVLYQAHVQLVCHLAPNADR